MREDESGWEEYFDYQFPDDENASKNNFKILEMAENWKKQQANAEAGSDSDDDSDLDDI